uniref:phosphate acyltransferase n=1 Tax=Sporosarcina sp. FSL W8-0480 TaxID=2954701 RepID=UPI00403F2695
MYCPFGYSPVAFRKLPQSHVFHTGKPNTMIFPTLSTDHSYYKSEAEKTTYGPFLTGMRTSLESLSGRRLPVKDRRPPIECR